MLHNAVDVHTRMFFFDELEVLLLSENTLRLLLNSIFFPNVPLY